MKKFIGSKDIRNKILAYISLALILCGCIGIHDDWTMYVLLVPFGWIIIGVLLDFIINGKNTSKEVGVIAILSALLLSNIALILVHRDTPFIIGRILCCTGIVILIIGTSKDIEDKDQCELNKTNQ